MTAILRSLTTGMVAVNSNILKNDKNNLFYQRISTELMILILVFDQCVTGVCSNKANRKTVFDHISKYNEES